MINKFHDSMQSKKSREVLSDLFGDLLDYAKTHFKNEEDYFDKYEYENAFDHQQEHAGFLVKVLDMKKRHESDDFLFSLEVMVFLKEWLINHILKTDKEYISCLKSNGL